MGRRTTLEGVSAVGERIQVRFRWRGVELRPTLPLKPTRANLLAAATLREDILREIREGRFDLTAHFPDYKGANRLITTKDVDTRTLREWADVWVKLQARVLEHATITIYRRHLEAYWLSAWGHMQPRAVTHEMVAMRLAELSTDREVDGKTRRGLSRKTQNNILVTLRGVMGLVKRNVRGFVDPTDGIENVRVQRNEPDPLTLAEVDAVLAKLARRSRELADYFEFACFAGLRTSEQIALLWEDIDMLAGTVRVRRARVLAEDKERTKTHYVRDVEMNARARAVITRMRSVTRLAGAHVFRNPFTGRPWHDDQEQRREWRAALKLAGVRYRPPKECRDTSVTLALAAGADPVWVAAQHGHSLAVMMRDYARWIPRADGGRNLARVDATLDAQCDAQFTEGKSSGSAT